jgi:hypothetical protein
MTWRAMPVLPYRSDQINAAENHEVDPGRLHAWVRDVVNGLAYMHKQGVRPGK